MIRYIDAKDGERTILRQRGRVMYKKDARFHYGILRHNKGTPYRDDYLVTDANYKTLRYIYKASAVFMAEELTKAHNGRCSFTVVRLD